jgi:tetratricopeptide (TPR) repeat protein
MYRLTRCRRFPIMLAAMLFAASAIPAQNARLEPKADNSIIPLEVPDDNGGFFLPNLESRTMLAAAQAAAFNEAGAAAYERGLYIEAIAAFRRSIELDDGLAAVHLNLSIALAKTGKDAEALGAALEAARLAPENTKARAAVCGLYLSSGNARTAIGCYDELIRLQPDDAPTLADRTSAIFMSGRKDEAIASMRQIVACFPAYADAQNYLGVMLYQTKQIGKAVDALRNAVSMDPASAQFRYNLGLAQMARNDKAGAVSQYTSLKTISPELANKLYRQIYADKILFVEK